jgi:hypothetical protein
MSADEVIQGPNTQSSQLRDIIDFQKPVHRDFLSGESRASGLSEYSFEDGGKKNG